MSVVLMLVVNIAMNSHFYPNLLKYQWGNTLAKVVAEKKWDKQKMVLYRIPNSNAFHFYGKHIFTTIADSSKLKVGDLVVTDSTEFASLKKGFPQSRVVFESARFHVTMLTLTFLNPATRNQEIIPFGVVELK